MNRILVFPIFFIYMMSSDSMAQIQSSINEITKFSSSPVSLVWDVSPAIQEVTSTVFYRLPQDEKPVWQMAPLIDGVTANRGSFNGQHNQKVEFRCAVFHPDHVEMCTINDFDSVYDQKMIAQIYSVKGINITLKINRDDVLQGDKSFRYIFRQRVKTPLEHPDKDFVSLVFNKRIPVHDWSKFRFLELYYKDNMSKPMDVVIQLPSTTYRAPVLDHSLGLVGDTNWHEIVIDLDQVVGPPENRTSIEAFGFIKYVKGMDLQKEHWFALDSVRIWNSRNIQSTRFDTTPPTAPEIDRHKIENNRILWVWKESQEDLSDILGYWYAFNVDARKAIPDTIMSDKPYAVFPYQPLPYFKVHRFYVAAQNSAGEWSKVTYKRLPINPFDSDSTKQDN
jgi:hypothetical protein